MQELKSRVNRRSIEEIIIMKAHIESRGKMQNTSQEQKSFHTTQYHNTGRHISPLGVFMPGKKAG